MGYNTFHDMLDQEQAEAEGIASISKPANMPTEPGHYWAKLVTPTRMPEGEDWASTDWEVVQVFANNGIGDETLAVHVPGISVSQQPKDFEWGAKLDLPKSHDAQKIGASHTYGSIGALAHGLPEPGTNLNAWINDQVHEILSGYEKVHYSPEAPDFLRMKIGDLARTSALFVMNDRRRLIDNMANMIFRRNVDVGWWSDLKTGESIVATRNVGELLMLMVSELAEAMEADRKNLPSDKLPGFSGVEEEIADLFIRGFDFAGAKQLRLGEAIDAKLEYNRHRADHKRENRLKEGGKAY